MENYFKNRKTVREYTGELISDGKINEMLEMAMHAPSTGNMQLYSVIVTKNKEILKELRESHFNQLASIKANVLLTFCADFNRFEKWCMINKAVPGYRNFQSFMSAVLDTVIFAQQFVTISEMNGYGCCYLGTTLYNADRISRILKLPDLVIPIVTISLGIPDEKEYSVSDRLSLEAVIHHDMYENYSDSKIFSLYNYKEKISDNMKYIRENKKETLAQVFTDIRYTKENNEYFSKVYYDLIREKGFEFPE